MLFLGSQETCNNGLILKVAENEELLGRRNKNKHLSCLSNGIPYYCIEVARFPLNEK